MLSGLNGRQPCTSRCAQLLIEPFFQTVFAAFLTLWVLADMGDHLDPVILSVCPCEKGSTSDGLKCVSCTEGKFKDSVGTGACTDCPEHQTSSLPLRNSCVCRAGYAASSESPGTCIACAPGKYKVSDGSESCESCWGNHSSAGASTSDTDCVCDIGFTVGPGIGTCLPCISGTYKTTIGSHECTLCPNHNQTVLDQMGMYNDCNCKVGFTGPDGGPCTQCPAGTYKDHRGTSACTLCPANSVSASGSHSAALCLCEAGYTSDGSGVCAMCEAGYYKNWTGMDECTVCPANAVSRPGSKTLSNCEVCPKHSIPDEEKSNCNCKVGFTGPDGGPCTQCPAGTYKDHRGTSACTLCPANSVSASGSHSAALCLCEAGYTSDGSGVCAMCEAGYYKNWTGMDECTVCPANAVSRPGSKTLSNCEVCPKHSIPDEEKSNCTCLPGFTRDRGDLCVTCDAGKFKSGVGDHACTTCPFRSGSAAGSTSEQACLCNAGSQSDGFGSCGLCPAGKFKGEEVCPIFWFCNRTGAPHLLGTLKPRCCTTYDKRLLCRAPGSASCATRGPFRLKLARLIASSAQLILSVW